MSYEGGSNVSETVKPENVVGAVGLGIGFIALTMVFSSDESLVGFLLLIGSIGLLLGAVSSHSLRT